MLSFRERWQKGLQNGIFPVIKSWKFHAILLLLLRQTLCSERIMTVFRMNSFNDYGTTIATRLAKVAGDTRSCSSTWWEKGEKWKKPYKTFFFDCLHFFSPECFAHKLFCVSLLYQNWKFTEFSTSGFVIYSKKVPGQTIKGPCLWIHQGRSWNLVNKSFSGVSSKLGW